MSAFALVNDRDHAVTPMIDARLIHAVRTAQHPLDNTRATVFTPGELRVFLALIGRKPKIVALSEQEPTCTSAATVS